MPRNHKTGGETYTPVRMPERQHSQPDFRTPAHPETDFETGLKSTFKFVGVGVVVFLVILFVVMVVTGFESEPTEEELQATSEALSATRAAR
jgi:hypothetical protein